MTRSFKSSLLATVLALTSFARPAAAASVAGSAAVVPNGADAGCFVEHGGAFKNKCTGHRLLRFHLSPDAVGWINVNVFAQGTGPENDVSCAGVTVDSERNYRTYTRRTQLPRWASTTQRIHLRVYLPAEGALWVDCRVNTDSFINSVTYVH